MVSAHGPNNSLNIESFEHFWTIVVKNILFLCAVPCSK